MPEARTGAASPRTYPRTAWSALARVAGRYPAGRFYEDLARLATDGRLGADDLLGLAHSGRATPKDHLDPRGVAWFGHVTASRVESPTRAEDAIRLFALAHRLEGRRIFSNQLDAVWVQAAHLAGCLDEHAGSLRDSTAPPDVWWAATTDALHPGPGSEPGDVWLTAFNQPFAAAGIEPLTLFDGPGNRFDRVIAEATSVPGDGLPLVSVVVPVHDPGPSLRTAVRSLCAQSWPNLEILLCDDASTTGVELIAEMAAADPRVRVVRAQRNGGAYSARNLGLGHARGTYVTFNDADDWSHPRRIELQVQALLDDPALCAVMSRSVRVTEELRLTVMGRPPQRTNLSSIMMRRHDLVRDLGGFDAVRRGADSEFVGRVRAFYGSDRLCELAEPLALVQLTSGSLSRDDYRFLHTHPARLHYTAGFRHWHDSLQHGDPDAYVLPGNRCPFPAPEHISGTPAAPPRADVLLLTNLSPTARTVVDLGNEVKALVEDGMEVGLLEYLGPYDTTDRIKLPSGLTADLLADRRVRWFLPEQEVSAAATVIRDPAAVASMPVQVLRAVTTAAVLVVADHDPLDGSSYDPAEVHQRLLTLTPQVCWLPATAAIARTLTDVLGPEVVEAPRPLACTRVRTSPLAGWPARPRIGVTLGATHQVAAKDLGRLLTGFLPRIPVCEVLTWGPPGQFARAIPDHVAHLDPASVPLEAFAGRVDAMVVAPARGRGPHLDPAAVLAMAHGAVVVLDPGSHEHFGDAAIYARAGEIDEALAPVLADPDLLEEQRGRARDFVRVHFSHRAYAEAVVAGLTAARFEGDRP